MVVAETTAMTTAAAAEIMAAAANKAEIRHMAGSSAA